MELENKIHKAVLILGVGAILVASSFPINKESGINRKQYNAKFKAESLLEQEYAPAQKQEARYKVVVDKSDFKLYLLRDGIAVKTYDVAVGAEKTPTLSGNFSVQTIDKNPDWYPPDSDWVAEELKEYCKAHGKIPAGDENNPIVAYWFGIGDGIGIHGTPEEYSIGKNASHGCVRMKRKDILELSDYVKIGTAVEIRD